MSVHVRLRVAAEEYAMPVGHVLEVTDVGQVWAVPRTRPELLGVQNLRGQILPVVDIAVLLRVLRTAPPSCLLVAEAGGRRAGFTIDDVSGVGLLAEPTMESESDLLLGTTLDGDDLIGVIDVPRLFDALQQVGQ